MPKKPTAKKKPAKTETALAIPEVRGQQGLTRVQKEAVNFLTPICPELPHYFETRKALARFCSTAFIALKREPKLLQCDPSSVALALSKAASLKLEVAGPLGHCFPIPFRDKKKGMVCQLIIGYPAWVLLILRNSHGFVKWINAEVVREGDVFEYELGARPKLRHIPKGDSSPLKYAYFVAGLADGQTVFKVLTKEEVMRAKNCSRGAWTKDGKPIKTHPWQNEHEPEQWKKTAIIRGRKILPIDTEEFSIAMAHEEELSDFSQELADPEGTVTTIPPDGGGNEKLKAAIKTPPGPPPLGIGMDDDTVREASAATFAAVKGDSLFNCKACGNELAKHGEGQAVCVKTTCDNWNKPIEA